MKRVFAIVGIVALLALAGCQRMEWTQFVASQAKHAELLTGIGALAAELGLPEDTRGLPVTGVLAVFANGERTYALIGVRRVKEDLVVDVMMRSYGKKDKVYESAVERVRELFQRTCGDQFTERSSAQGREQMIPIEG
jgi:hypothetical protein